MATVHNTSHMTVIPLTRLAVFVDKIKQILALTSLSLYNRVNTLLTELIKSNIYHIDNECTDTDTTLQRELPVSTRLSFLSQQNTLYRRDEYVITVSAFVAAIILHTDATIVLTGCNKREYHDIHELVRFVLVYFYCNSDTYDARLTRIIAADITEMLTVPYYSTCVVIPGESMVNTAEAKSQYAKFELKLLKRHIRTMHSFSVRKRLEQSS